MYVAGNAAETIGNLVGNFGLVRMGVVLIMGGVSYLMDLLSAFLVPCLNWHI